MKTAKTPINLMEIDVNEKLDIAIDEAMKDFVATLTYTHN